VCTSQAYLINVHLMGVYLIGVYLMGVYLMGVYLMGVYLIGVHLIGVHLMGVYLIGDVPLITRALSAQIRHLGSPRRRLDSVLRLMFQRCSTSIRYSFGIT